MAQKPTSTPNPTKDGVEFVEDEYDRKVDGQRETMKELATDGALDYETMIEKELDRTDVKGVPRNIRLKWVNRGSRDGIRVQEHIGLGFWIVKAAKYPSMRPVCAIKKEDCWIQGDLLLMAETQENFRKRYARKLHAMERQGVLAREGAKEEINRLIRNEGGGTPFRDAAVDQVIEKEETTLGQIHKKPESAEAVLA